MPPCDQSRVFRGQPRYGVLRPIQASASRAACQLHNWGDVSKEPKHSIRAGRPEPIGGLIPDLAREPARRRNRTGSKKERESKKARSWKSRPFWQVPKILKWIKVENARGHLRKLAGRCQEILAHISSVEAQWPERRVRGPNDVLFHQLSINRLARELGCPKSQSWVCTCLGRLVQYGFIERRAMKRFVRDERYLSARQAQGVDGRVRMVGVKPHNEVYLTRLTAAGRKLLGMPLMDVDGCFGRSLHVDQAKGRPCYTGRGRWGKPKRPSLGQSLYELWRERLPGVLERSQLELADFVQPEPEYCSGAPPPD